MGAGFTLPIAESPTLLEDLSTARDESHWHLIAAASDERSEPLAEAMRPPRIVLVLGNEAEGLSDDWLAACDRQVMIPMASAVDSLNVAVAAGVMLHHFLWMAPVTPHRPGAMHDTVDDVGENLSFGP